MPEPVTSSSATAAVIGVGLLSLLPGVDASVVMGAFAGAVVFVTASDDLSNVKKFSFFIPAFIAGLLTASEAAKLIGTITPSGLSVSPGLGAMVAAAVVVKTLVWLVVENPLSILDALRSRKG